MSIKINSGFKAVLLPLSKEARAGLESSIIDDGCREPLVLWGDILVDGHNRFDICQRRGIKFKTVEKDFGDEGEAKEWILSNQMNRRNMTLSEAALIRGRLYEARKKKRGGTGANQHRTQIAQNELSATAEVIAKEGGVSAATVKRDAQFALAVDALVSVDRDIVQRATRGVEDINGNIESVSRQDVIKAHQAWQSGDKAKAKKILSNNRAHVANNSGEQEWYTPPEFIEAARLVMGSIDCDPASSAIANKTVQAKKFFTKEQDGLTKNWNGNVWLNPPYARPLIEQFSEAVSTKYASGEIPQAIVLVNNATETAWFSRMAMEASAICFPCSRIRFLDTDGNPSGSPLQGQAFIYFGKREKTFIKDFSAFGFALCRP